MTRSQPDRLARRHREKSGQALARCGRHRRGDPTAVTAVDHSARRAGEPQERAEGGQLAALTQQLFDASIDDVGQIVTGARRLDTRPHGDTARRTIVAGNANEAAYERGEADAIIVSS